MAKQLKHVRIGTFKNSPVIEFHDDPDASDENANKFTRFTFGAGKAAKIARSVIANGPAAVLTALAEIASSKLTEQEQATLNSQLEALNGKALRKAA